MENLTDWLNAKTIPLNVYKTELVILSTKKKKKKRQTVKLRLSLQFFKQLSNQVAKGSGSKTAKKLKQMLSLKATAQPQFSKVARN